MGLSIGEYCVPLEDILYKVNETDILNHYFNISTLPVVINSPLRVDHSPSFGIYINNNNRIHYTDFATGDKGNLFDLLMKYFSLSYNAVLVKIKNELPSINKSDSKDITYLNKNNNRTYKEHKQHRESKIECKIRKWRDYDINYWKSFGISLEWLKYAEVYPVSYTILTKNNKRYVFPADKYAYSYIERKEGKITMKIYQPYNKNGFKWCSKHNKSVISLWTKIPETGDKVCICSSVKDALCLSCQTGIPAIAIQGEGYSISNTAIKELRRRFNNVYILLDNDKTGLRDGVILSIRTGFKNVVLPKVNDAKDISDLYKSLQNPEEFKRIILNLFN